MLLVLTLACDDTEFPPPSGGGGGTVVGGDDFSDVLTIFEDVCYECHGPVPAGNTMDMETDPCAALVGVTSPVYDDPRVVPGDHEASVLWHKIDDDGAYGGVMPLQGRMDQANIDAITGWIDGGAVGCGDEGGAP